MKKEILGVQIDDISTADALVKVKELLDSGKQGYIVTPNPEIVMLSQKDSRYREIVNAAFLALPDGFGITAAGTILGESFQERIPGVDFVFDLAGLAQEHGYNMFLLGGEEGVAEAGGENLQKEFPRLNIVGTLSPGVLEKNREKILQEVQRKSIDILLVAFGPPRQEVWIAENLPKLNTKVAMGVGGTLDFLSGKKKRAPVLIRKIGLEWVFRLFLEPKRITRQIKLPLFIIQVLKEKIK